MNNNAEIDVINVAPRDDDSGTNLTVPGGLALFDCQVLRSTTEAHTLATIAGNNFHHSGRPPPAPIWVRLICQSHDGRGRQCCSTGEREHRHWYANRCVERRHQLSSEQASPTLCRSLMLISFTNTIFNYGPATAVNLVDGSGRIVFDENTVTGIAGTSNNGLICCQRPPVHRRGTAGT